ncbi:MAG TPA: aminoglycoside phosphotransferase family protein [Pseudonocardiaceae bacterium]|nr:aminoglycoside phosphotransferase family protein [Pseudonocardiaceae bacterium]
MTVSAGGAAGSQSGAGVSPVRLASGEPAYLKTTPAPLGPEALAAARRELRFYRHVGPGLAVPTPELLGWRDTDDGVALLLASAGGPVPVRAWTPAMWAALGDRLAVLHDTPVPHAWARPDPLTGDLSAAYWDDVPDVRAQEVLDSLAALAPVFGHGDCHSANVVWRDGRLTLCDWQTSGVGRPGSDLAFPAVRAAPEGVQVPPDLVDAYARRRGCDAAVVRRAVLAEELAILLYLWPPFAKFHTDAAIGRVRERLRTLVARWQVDR